MTHATAAPRLRRDERIGIVGAGPAGVHLAHLLHRRGFRAVTVLERGDAIGGKVLSVAHAGATFELGACYIPPNYTEYCRLLTETGAGKIVSPPKLVRDVFARRDGVLSRHTFDEWIEAVLARAVAGGKLRAGGNLRRLFEVLGAVSRLRAERRRLLGEGIYPLARLPDRDTLRTLAAPFGEVIERCRLHVLEPFFRIGTTAQGYGVLETMPSYYPLLWNEEGFVRSFVATRLHLTRHPIASTVDTGVQTVFPALAARDGLDVRLGHEVVSIDRLPAQAVTVAVRTPTGPQELLFDQLVLACDLQAALPWLTAASDDERYIFSRFVHSTFVTTLFEAPQWPQAAYAFNVADTLLPSPTFTVSGVRERRFLTPDAPGDRAMAVAYQFRQGESGPSVVEEFDRRFAPEMRQLGFHDLTIIDRRNWTYCPQFPAEGIAEGLPWRIFAGQGRNRTWYAGSSASFESLNDVMHYNTLLVRSYADA